MKHFLVPTDFSQTAENALKFAVETTQYVPARITLLHSFEVNNNIYVDYQGLNKEFNTRMIAEMEERLNKIKQDILNRYNLEIDTVISTEPLQDAIFYTAKDKKTDLIIMGTLGAGGLKSKLWGSRTSIVIGRSKVPVLAVPHDYQWKKPETLLLATNQFVKKPETLNFVFELAGLYLADVHAAVFTNEEDDKAGTFITHQTEIAEYGNYLKEKYKEKNLCSAHLYGNNFEDTLEDYIQKEEIDLLTMITRKKNFWQNLFDPSITRRMSFHSKIPLLAIPESFGDSE